MLQLVDADRDSGECPCNSVKNSLNDNICLIFSSFARTSGFFHEWAYFFNKVMGAPNNKFVPELVNVYKSPRKDGTAILTKKLHRNGVLPNDVTFFAPCQVGGFIGGKKSHVTIQVNRMASISSRRSNLIPWRVKIAPRRAMKHLSVCEIAYLERTIVLEAMHSSKVSARVSGEDDDERYDELEAMLPSTTETWCRDTKFKTCSHLHVKST